MISSSQVQPGLHGKSLVLTVALGGFIIGTFGVRSILLAQPANLWAWGPTLGLVLLSSAVLAWLQPVGSGGSGALSVATIVAGRLLPKRFVLPLLLFVTALAACTVTLSAVANDQRHGSPGLLTKALPYTGLFVVAVLIWRFRQRREEEARQRVRAEETRNAELRAATLAERQRLAREMHDVLAHSLSGLLLQLEGARLLALSDPSSDQLAVTISRAHRLAKSGLDEARWAIGMLRDDELPGPARLAALAGTFEADTGVPCRFTSTGIPRELMPAVRLALYRIAQEALTNARKHAEPDRVDVRLTYEPSEVELTVADWAAEPAGRPPFGKAESTGTEVEVSGVFGGGYGLTGMRERAELLGGSLTAEPTDHGFLVSLRVPA